MSRYVEISKIPQPSDSVISLFSNFNPFIANLIDSLDKKEKDLQDMIDDQCLKYAQKLAPKTKLTFENHKSLLRVSTTNKIKRELEEQLRKLEQENRELKEILSQNP